MDFLATTSEIFDFIGIADPDAKTETATFLMYFGRYATEFVDPTASRKKIRRAEREIAKTLVGLSELMDEYDVRVGFMPYGQIVLLAKSDAPEMDPIKTLEEFREISEEKAIVALTPGMEFHLAFYVIDQTDGDGDEDEEPLE